MGVVVAVQKAACQDACRKALSRHHEKMKNLVLIHGKDKQLILSLAPIFF